MRTKKHLRRRREEALGTAISDLVYVAEQYSVTGRTLYENRVARIELLRTARRYARALFALSRA